MVQEDKLEKREGQLQERNIKEVEKPDSIDRPDLKLEEGKDLLFEKALDKMPDTSKDKDREPKNIEDDNIAGTYPAGTSSVSDIEQRKIAIENILSEGLKDAYLGMPTNKQKVFKKTGEEVTEKINDLLAKTKVNIKKIADLIRRWLMIIPGVNLCFIEQEAKNKADKISKLK